MQGVPPFVSLQRKQKRNPNEKHAPIQPGHAGSSVFCLSTSKTKKPYPATYERFWDKGKFHEFY
jgi:hypothetical protein